MTVFDGYIALGGDVTSDIYQSKNEKMLFKFKKNSVKKKVVEQLNNVTFNYQLAENYQLEKQATITMNNSYYFCAHSIDKKQSLIVRLENRVDYSEVWFYYSEGNFDKAEEYGKVVERKEDDSEGLIAKIMAFFAKK